jgi:hypothetical protein
MLREEYMRSLNKLKKLYDSGEIVLNKILLEKVQIYLGTDKIKKLVGQEGGLTEDELIKILKRKKREREGTNIKSAVGLIAEGKQANL